MSFKISLFKNLVFNPLLLALMIILVTSCQVEEQVTPKDQNRFEPVPTPTPDTSVTFASVENLTTFEATAVSSNTLSCTHTTSTSAPTYRIVKQTFNATNCVVGGSPSVIICLPSQKAGHTNNEYYVTVSCEIDDVEVFRQFEVTVNDLNLPPDLDSHSNQTLYAGNAITQVNSGQDELDVDGDGDTLTFSCTFTGGDYSSATNCDSLPGSNFSFSSSSGILNWTPSIAAVTSGTSTIYTIVISASDDQSPALTDTTSFTVSVFVLDPPTFVSATPVSPTNASTTPAIVGTAPSSSSNITFYSDSSCLTSIGGGTRAAFVGAGVTANVSANGTTTIYGVVSDANSNRSRCTYLTDYVHDNVPPTNPSFISFSLSSPSNTSNTPNIVGSASSDTSTLTFYSNSTCTTNIGSGNRATFVGAGISITAATNATTTVYAKAFDSLNNGSSCVFMSSYTHDTIAPADPVFVSSNPASPSSTSINPAIKGTVDATTTTVNLYDDVACSNLLTSSTKAIFENAGLSVNVAANSTTSLYAQAIDLAGNPSNCTLMLNYTHDNIGPTAPVFSAFNPVSPSSASNTPDITGTSSADTDSLYFYSDSNCATQVGTGNKALFEGGGITLTLSANAQSTIYAKAFDSLLNSSSCTVMGSFLHDNVGPNDPSYVSTNPVSPNNTSNTPFIIGAASADTAVLTFFSNIACTVQIGTGTKADFESSGIEITATANATSSVYVEAEDSLGNKGNCIFLVTYIHDNTPPADPVFTSTDPATPNNSSVIPEVIGTVDAETTTVKLYSDASCVSLIGSGTKALYESTGITASVSSNLLTSIYGKSFDSLNNSSNCVLLVNYTHDNTGPTNPTLTSLNPTSPSNASNTPAIVGNASGDTATLNFYSDVSCSTQVGTGTKAAFEGAGITLTFVANTTTNIYAKAFDSLSNGSSCILLTSYTHDTVAPADPTFVSTVPATPSSTDTAPEVRGSASADTNQIVLYSDIGCTSILASGSKSLFEGAGITIAATSNSTTAVYAKAFDSALNPSACVALVSYVHDNISPTEPIFVSLNPASPNNSSTTPDITGTASADTTSVSFYDDSGCTNLIGSGTKANFEGAGISLTVTANATSSIYGKSFDSLSNASDCTLLANYTHDNTAPVDPVFILTNPSSPSASSITPSIKGSSSADTQTLNFYSDALCSVSLGSGSKVNFESAGISISVTANTTTNIYVQALDSLNNPSTCLLLTSYTHDNVVPANPAFVSTNPASPSGTTLTPTVIGTTDVDTVSLNLYSNAACTNQIGTGTKATYIGAGISATVGSNAITAIYGRSFDSLNNFSNCVLLTNFTHDSIVPDAVSSLADGTFSSSTTDSPTLTWAATTDNLSGIDYYEVALGSTSGGTDIVNWTDIGNVTSYSFSGLALVSGNTYYATIRAVDLAGNISSATNSNGWTVDNSAPSSPVVSIEGCTVNTLTASWSSSSDLVSGVSSYSYSIGTSAGATDITNWTNNNLSLALELNSQSFIAGNTHYLNVRSTNGAGLTSGVASSSAVCSDLETSLMAYWNFDEASGDRFDEFLNNDLTDSNTVTSATGKINLSASFNSLNLEGLLMTSSADVSTADNDWTLSIWVYIADNSVDQVILGKWGGSTNEYRLEWDNAGSFIFSYGLGTVSKVQSINNNTWYHLLLEHDSTNDKLFISVNNGVATNANHAAGASAGDSDLVFGHDELSVNYFSGRLDQIGIWKRLLSIHEKELLYNSASALGYPF